MTAQEFLATWTQAELDADREALAQMLTDDFTGIGPLGFTLSKQDWLDRHGPLAYQELELTDIVTRTYGEVVIATATQTQQATFKENKVPGTFRTTVVLVHKENAWKIANVQFSFVAGAEGSPA
jgi:ketosteroid isomerase-like protein